MDQLLPNVRRLAQQTWGLVLMTSLLVACVCLQSPVAGATTTPVTIASSASTAADAWIREASPTANNGNSVNPADDRARGYLARAQDQRARSREILGGTPLWPRRVSRQWP